MNFIIGAAFLASVGVITWKSYRTAFLYVYIPILVCLPAWPRWILPALPDPTFQQAALLPIAAVSLYRGNHRLSPLDYLVLGFLMLCGLSEFINAGYAEAQNLMFDMIASGALPYLVARDVLAKPLDRVKAVKIFVLCTSGVVVAAIFEARFGTNPFRLLFDPFFPGQGAIWVTTFRYGLARAAGPYGHAILAGIMFMIALRLQCWLQASGLWKSEVSQMHVGSVKLSSFLTAWNCLGLFVTWVRGPQLGALLAWLLFRVSRGKTPLLNFRRTLVIFSVALIPVSLWFYSYVSVGRASAVTAGQESAAYRKELLQKYAATVFNHSWFGWGRNGWPKEAGMPSIDNYYLLVGLMHGLPAVCVFTAILIVVSTRLFKTGIRFSQADSARASLSFTLFSIYVGLSFSLATSYMGENVFATFFFLLGLTEAFLQGYGATATSPTAATVRRVDRLPRFRRVLA